MTSIKPWITPLSTGVAAASFDSSECYGYDDETGDTTFELHPGAAKTGSMRLSCDGVFYFTPHDEKDAPWQVAWEDLLLLSDMQDFIEENFDEWDAHDANQYEPDNLLRGAQIDLLETLQQEGVMSMELFEIVKASGM